jgi:hypothetical protein
MNRLPIFFRPNEIAGQIAGVVWNLSGSRKREVFHIHACIAILEGYTSRGALDSSDPRRRLRSGENPESAATFSNPQRVAPRLGVTHQKSRAYVSIPESRPVYFQIIESSVACHFFSWPVMRQPAFAIGRDL